MPAEEMIRPSAPARAPTLADIEAVIRCWNTAPSAATPVARPPMRNVLLRPDAMPLRSGGTTPDDARDGGIAMPMPKPESSIPG